MYLTQSHIRLTHLTRIHSLAKPYNYYSRHTETISLISCNRRVYTSAPPHLPVSYNSNCLTHLQSPLLGPPRINRHPFRKYHHAGHIAIGNQSSIGRRSNSSSYRRTGLASIIFLLYPLFRLSLSSPDSILFASIPHTTRSNHDLHHPLPSPFHRSALDATASFEHPR